MRRTLVLALGLLVVPAMAAAQVEVGLDAGFIYSDVDGAADAAFGFSAPFSAARVGFAAGENMIIETRLGFDWIKQGDASGSNLDVVPGLNYLVNDQIYVRGEAGLSRQSYDPGTGGSSQIQYLFGGGLGMRRPLGAALLRLEAGVVKGLENTDDGIPSNLDFHATVGVSAVIN